MSRDVFVISEATIVAGTCNTQSIECDCNCDCNDCSCGDY